MYVDSEAKAAARRIKQACESGNALSVLGLLKDAMILVEELERLDYETTPDSYPEPYCPHCDEES